MLAPLVGAQLEPQSECTFTLSLFSHFPLIVKATSSVPEFLYTTRHGLARLASLLLAFHITLLARLLAVNGIESTSR